MNRAFKEPRDRHAVIVGCGRVGTGLAHRLVREGYSVAIIDRNPLAFRRLAGLDVAQLVGVGFDRATLLSAGVERADALAAVTNGDNSNIVVARTAHETFGVPRVVARIYDARRAAIYERLGITTVASAELTTEMAVRRILPDDEAIRWIDQSARVCLVERHVPDPAAGRLFASLESAGSARVVAVRRLGVAMLPAADLVMQEGDVVYLAIAHEDLAGVDGLFATSPHNGGH